MMKRQIVDDRLYIHFVTFSCDRRRRLLNLDQPKRIVLGALNQDLRRIDGKCIGFVIMPDHVHAMVWFPKLGCLSGFMHEWKRFSSRVIREWYRSQSLKYFDNVDFGDRFWQPKYHSFEIYGEKKVEQKLDYMHMNPVRAGLVEQAIHWPWSSARWYVERRNVGVTIECIG